VGQPTGTGLAAVNLVLISSPNAGAVI